MSLQSRRQVLSRVLSIGAGAASAALLAACGAGTAVSSATSAAAAVTSSAAAVATSAAAVTSSAAAATTSAAAVTTSAAAAAATTWKIGIDLPITGADGSDGVPAMNGAKLAIQQANDKQLVPGVTFVATPLDDAVNGVHDPQQGARNIQTFIQDKQVIGVVGPFNSNVAQAEIPLTNEAGLAQISPSNTNQGLTKPEFGGDKLRTSNPTKIAYFRVCTTDDIQGPAGADFTIDTLGKKAVFIVDDNETYGAGIADTYSAEFTKKGGKVLGHEHFTKGQTDFKSLITKIQSMSPDVVYFGGTSSNGGGLFRAQMADAGMAAIPYVAGDGISDATFIKDAGAAADNAYYTVAAVYANALPAAKQFITDYTAAYKSDIGAYSANAFDCAGIIINAVGIAAKAGSVTRETVRAAVAATKGYQGVIGTTSFDANGDTTNRIISIYEVKAGKTIFSTQLNFQ